MNTADLEQSFPGIKWREPFPVAIMGRREKWIGCRLCIAKFGIKAADIDKTAFAFRSETAWAAHMAQKHPR